MLKPFVPHRATSLSLWCRVGFAVCCIAGVMDKNWAVVITPPFIPHPGEKFFSQVHSDYSPLEGGQGGVASAHRSLTAPLITSRHPFYVSICQIDHNTKTKTLEITFKIFAEDLESALEAQGAARLHLGSERESNQADRYIHNYLKSHVTLQVDGDTVAFTYVGKEIEMDEAWCYVEVANVPSVNKLTIRNSILMEQFEAQQNIVHVRVGGKQKSLVLWKDKREGSVEF